MLTRKRDQQFRRRVVIQPLYEEITTVRPFTLRTKHHAGPIWRNGGLEVVALEGELSGRRAEDEIVSVDLRLGGTRSEPFVNQRPAIGGHLQVAEIALTQHEDLLFTLEVHDG